MDCNDQAASMLLSLPNEVLQLILRFDEIDHFSLCQLSLVCRRLKLLVSESKLWNLKAKRRYVFINFTLYPFRDICNYPSKLGVVSPFKQVDNIEHCLMRLLFIQARFAHLCSAASKHFVFADSPCEHLIFFRFVYFMYHL